MDSFYMASRNRVLKWLIPRITTEDVNRSFVAVTGGDFATQPEMINTVYGISRFVSSLFPWQGARLSPAPHRAIQTR